MIGFGGWLLLGLVSPEGLAPSFVLAFAMGLIVAVATRRLVGLAGLFTGVIGFYAAALGLGLIAFLGENWEFYLGMFAAISIVGFAIGWLLTSSPIVQDRLSRSSPR